MQEIGDVIEVSDENVTLRMKRSLACGPCGSCSSHCSRKGEIRISVSNECHAKKQDRVIVEMHPGPFVKIAIFLYGLPLAGFLTGIFIGVLFCGIVNWESHIGPIGLFFGVILMYGVYKIIKRFEPKLRKKAYRPAAVKVVEDYL